jgi:hypothetical protein
MEVLFAEVSQHGQAVLEFSHLTFIMIANTVLHSLLDLGPQL